MSKIEDLNGQAHAINAIFSPRPSYKELFTIRGPKGSGVKWTLNKCAQKWKDSGGMILQLKGDPLAKGRSLFPWLTMTAPGAAHVARLEVLKETASQSSKSIPFVGAAASYLVQEVLNYQKRSLARRTSFLSQQEQDILYVLQLSARQDRLMLIIEQIENWDEDSLNLLALMLSDKLDDLYPALLTSTFIIGSSSNNDFSKLDEITDHLSRTEFSLRLLNQNEMPIVLQTFNFPVMSSEDQDKLYKITNNRLDLISDVSAYFKKTGNYSLLPSKAAGFYSSLIEKRIDEIKTQINNLESVLRAAAIVGETFSYNDIACLTNSTFNSITETLNIAISEQFINVAGSIARFNSSELYQYFHESGVSEHLQYHSKFAECLRFMRPGDYQHRSYHLLFSEEIEKSQICYVLSVLSALREYRAVPDNTLQSNNSNSNDFNGYLKDMTKAFQSFESGEVAVALNILEQIEGFLPKELLAERDYLEAVILLATSSVNNYERARRLLERWIYFEEEGELWSRIAQNLIMAQVQTGYIEQALELEEKLTAYYFQRRQTDPWALLGLNILRRRSECLHTLPVANDRLVKALTFFGTGDPDYLPRHPIQFYYTLNNLVGCLIARGRFEEASNRALSLEDLIKQHPSIPWPLLEIATNNSILAHYYSGKLTAKEALKLISQIVKQTSETGDTVLLQNNLAVFLILNGKSIESKKILKLAYNTIMKSEYPDIYHQYFVCNNLGTLLMLEGKIDEARKIIDSCNKNIGDFYPAIKPTIELRQELLKKIFAHPPKINPIDYDDFIIQKYGMQIGEQWAFYGRGFLLTDIQFWTMD